jgi:hypothetical protein
MGCDVPHIFNPLLDDAVSSKYLGSCPTLSGFNATPKTKGLGTGPPKPNLSKNLKSSYDRMKHVPIRFLGHGGDRQHETSHSINRSEWIGALTGNQGLNISFRPLRLKPILSKPKWTFDSANAQLHPAYVGFPIKASVSKRSWHSSDDEGEPIFPPGSCATLLKDFERSNDAKCENCTDI